MSRVSAFEGELDELREHIDDDSKDSANDREREIRKKLKGGQGIIPKQRTHFEPLWGMTLLARWEQDKVESIDTLLAQLAEEVEHCQRNNVSTLWRLMPEIGAYLVRHWSPWYEI